MFELKMSGLGMNALGTEMMRFILAQLAAAGGEPVLVTGGGFAFSAGLDLRELLALDAPGTADFLALLERTTVALYTYPAPMVAHVNGHAIAGGCIVALCCDWRVARRQAPLKMGLNEVALGLRFPPRILRLLRARCERRHLDELVLGAGLHGPEEALRLGLLDELADDPRAAAVRRLEALAAHPPAAFAAAKRDVKGTLDVDPEEDRIFLEEGLPMWTSPASRALLTRLAGGRS